MKKQDRLEYLTRSTFQELNIPAIRGVSASWEGKTAHIRIFVSQNLNESQKENVDVGVVEIISQFSSGSLEDEFIYLPTNKSLPSISWAYKKN